MAIHRHAAKRDANEPDIIAALRAAGASVQQVSGRDVLDLIVGYRGVTYLIEVKSPGKKATLGQRETIDNWRGGPAGVVWSVDDALRMIGATP